MAKIAEAFVLICNLGLADGVKPLNEHDACWERQIDKQWWMAVNGHPLPQPQSHSKALVDPFTAYVEFNGWPAGVIAPNGGVIAAGTVANEDIFCAALEAEIASVKALE